MYEQLELIPKSEDQEMVEKLGKASNQLKGLFKRMGDLNKDLNKVADDMNQIMDYKDARMR